MTSNKTLSIIVKDKIANMSDNFNDKEILNYIKEAIKEAKVEVKTKKVSKNNNSDEKPKYSLSAYQEFMKEQQIVFKDKYPNLSSKERLGKIAEEWNKVKLDKKNNNNEVNVPENVPENVPDNVVDNVPDNVPDNVLDNVPEKEDTVEQVSLKVSPTKKNSKKK